MNEQDVIGYVAVSEATVLDPTSTWTEATAGRRIYGNPSMTTVQVWTDVTGSAPRINITTPGAYLGEVDQIIKDANNPQNAMLIQLGYDQPRYVPVTQAAVMSPEAGLNALLALGGLSYTDLQTASNAIIALSNANVDVSDVQPVLDQLTATYTDQQNDIAGSGALTQFSQAASNFQAQVIDSWNTFAQNVLGDWAVVDNPTATVSGIPDRDGYGAGFPLIDNVPGYTGAPYGQQPGQIWQYNSGKTVKSAQGASPFYGVDTTEGFWRQDNASNINTYKGSGQPGAWFPTNEATRFPQGERDTHVTGTYGRWTPRPWYPIDHFGPSATHVTGIPGGYAGIGFLPALAAPIVLDGVLVAGTAAVLGVVGYILYQWWNETKLVDGITLKGQTADLLNQIKAKLPANAQAQLDQLVTQVQQQAQQNGFVQGQNAQKVDQAGGLFSQLTGSVGQIALIVAAGFAGYLFLKKNGRKLL